MATPNGSSRHPSPLVPVSCGAILLDGQGKLLVVKPSYKSGWSIPGGSMRAGESPWQCCRREVREETGLPVSRGRMVVVDTRPHSDGRQMGMRLLFHCGTVAAEDAATIRIKRGEISEYRFVTVPEAMEMLRPAIARRMKVGLETRSCTYLEDGRRVPGIIG
ncbi:NUDIX hydrolase [Luteococcus peritonei]|uniref:NUDIX domain-containing protein n=1 Tax=Luteococcus peritonei TaxID=88874 RepID=A0ABW4RVT4_9ACTN